MTIDKFYLDDANVLCLIEHTPCVLNMYSIHRYSWITVKEDLQSSIKRRDRDISIQYNIKEEKKTTIMATAFLSAPTIKQFNLYSSLMMYCTQLI